MLRKTSSLGKAARQSVSTQENSVRPGLESRVNHRGSGPREARTGIRAVALPSHDGLSRSGIASSKEQGLRIDKLKPAGSGNLRR